VGRPGQGQSPGSPSRLSAAIQDGDVVERVTKRGASEQHYPSTLEFNRPLTLVPRVTKTPPFAACYGGVFAVDTMRDFRGRHR
jgi:hypothetical protein